MTTYSDPTHSLTDHTATMLRLEHLLAEHCPEMTSGDRIGLVVEIMREVAR